MKNALYSKIITSAVCILISATSLFCQSYKNKTYKNYKIVCEYTEISGDDSGYVVDTITNKKVKINFQSLRCGSSYFDHGFVFVRTSDMRGLMKITGEKVLDYCNSIYFNDADSIIISWDNSYHECYLNFNGDTISYGEKRNIAPDDSLSVNYLFNRRTGQYYYGFVDKNNSWKIYPRFQYVLPFQNKSAKVKINNLWGTIDRRGKYIIKPKYKTPDF